MEHTHSTSFGWYEACRILVPGFTFTCLLMFFILAVWEKPVPPPQSGLGLAIGIAFLTIVAGLTMYAKETQKRRRAFTENQPSRYLQQQARVRAGASPLSDEDAQLLYFYILNHHIPSVFHDKIFFFGTMYHIMIQIRRTSFWFGLLAAAEIGLQAALGIPLSSQPHSLLFALFVWTVYMLNVRYNKADRKMQENYRDQIFWLEMNDDIVKSVLQRYAKRVPPK